MNESEGKELRVGLSWRCMGTMIVMVGGLQGIFSAFVIPTILDKVSSRIDAAIDRHLDRDRHPGIVHEKVVESCVKAIEKRLERIEAKLDNR